MSTANTLMTAVCVGLLFLGIHIITVTQDVTQNVVTETSSGGEVVLRNNSGYRVFINGRSYAPGVHSLDVEPGTRLDVAITVLGIPIPLGVGEVAEVPQP